MRTVLLALLCAGCSPPSSNWLPSIDDPGVKSSDGPINVQPNPKVDILFLVDSSNSMAAMQDELKARFSEFLKVFVDLASNDSYADLHVGVVSSDYGAGATGAPGCDPAPGGRRGELQALGVAADPGCQPPVDAPFIRYNLSGSNNLPDGQDLFATFTCMASVGVGGCGFEHQLESVYAALIDDHGANVGFLRDDARLMVVFITNEDDGSAPADSDLFDKNKTAQYGFESSYRQTHYGIVCGSGSGSPPPYADSQGLLTGCRPAPSPPGKEFDVGRYLWFFALPKDLGGIKEDPNDVFLAAIDAPSSPVQVILSNPGTPAGAPYVECGLLNEASNPPCVPVVQHSCMNPQAPAFFGDPAVRLNTVVGAIKNHRIASICDPDFTQAMRMFSVMLASHIGGCLPWEIDLAQPDCDVDDVTPSVDGTPTHTALARCTDGGAFPCWQVSPQAWCVETSPQSAAVAILRGGQAPPDGTVTHVDCRPSR